MIFLLIASVPWQAIGVVLTAIVSLVSAIFVFINSRNSDKALESATYVQTAFDGQKSLVDALQEEIMRYRDESREHASESFKCRQECDELKAKVANTEVELRRAKSEIASLKKRLHEAGISVW